MVGLVFGKNLNIRSFIMTTSVRDAYRLVCHAENMDDSSDRELAKKIHAFLKAVDIYAEHNDFQHASYFMYIAASEHKDSDPLKKFRYQKALEYFRKFKDEGDCTLTTMRSDNSFDVLRDHHIKHIKQEVGRL